MLPRTAAVLLAAALASGCTGGSGGDGADGPDRAEPVPSDVVGPDGGPRREVVVDLGAADVVDLRPARVEAAPGDLVVVRSGNPGAGTDDESPVQHLFSSAGPAELPPLFVRAGEGAVPNPGIWGLCRGGRAVDATRTCPVPPVEGPRRYDGTAYFSLGSLVPGQTRELPLAEDLPAGTYPFLCAVHPQLRVDVVVTDDPQPAEERPPLDAAAARRAAAAVGTAPAAEAPPPTPDGPPADATVVLAPVLGTPPAEVLAAVPRQVRVPVGGTVSWRVTSRSPHTVELGLSSPPLLADTSSADSVPVLPAGGAWDGTGVVRSGYLGTDPSLARPEFRLRFTRPGTYTAYDRFHVGVVTTVVVG